MLEHTSSKYSHLALFLFNRVSIVVSVESTDLLSCSSYKVRFTQLYCSLEVATTLPRDWSGTGPAGATLKPPAHRLALQAVRIERNMNWQLGLKGANLKGGEAGRLIPQLGETGWASGGWRDEWSANRVGLDAEGYEAQFATSCQAKRVMNNRSNHILDQETHKCFLLISWRHCASSFCPSQSFSCLLLLE